ARRGLSGPIMPSRNRLLRVLVLGFALGLAACGTISRPPDGVVRLAEIAVVPGPDPRIRAGDVERLERLADEIAAELQERESGGILALSGGEIGRAHV